MATSDPRMRIAVIIPCRNEEATIAETVRGFAAALPAAQIYVCDNASSDASAREARMAGATVLFEARPGKGEAVRRLFADVEADVYLMVDGDVTYDAAAAPRLVQRLVEGNLDMVVANRLNGAGAELFRRGHQFGNRMFSWIAKLFFNSPIEDLLSGYRAMSRRFVKTFPSESVGFEIETELTVHALEARVPIAEIDTDYFVRPEGSESKLSTYRDGLRISLMILRLLRDVKPLQFFLLVALATMLLALALSLPIIETYLESGLVPRIPTAILITGLFVLSFVFLTCGIILERISAERRMLYRMHYLSIPGPAQSWRAARAPDFVVDGLTEGRAERQERR